VLDYALGLLQGTGASASVIEWMRKPMSATRTLGWERWHAGWSGGDQCTDQCIGHTGFTGTGLWVDFGSGIAWTLLTNRIHPTRHADSGIAQLRRDVSNAINTSGK
jgi:CubicO group peptidase (beta-lactamase class C family)